MVKEKEILKPYMLYEHQQAFISGIPNTQSKQSNLPAVPQNKPELTFFFFLFPV